MQRTTVGWNRTRVSCWPRPMGGTPYQLSGGRPLNILFASLSNADFRTTRCYSSLQRRTPHESNASFSFPFRQLPKSGTSAPHYLTTTCFFVLPYSCSRGHIIIFNCMKGHHRGHPILFVLCKGQPIRHFLSYSPLQRAFLQPCRHYKDIRRALIEHVIGVSCSRSDFLALEGTSS